MSERELSAQLAHDLRMPLATIMMWQQVAQLTEDPEMRSYAIEKIREAALEQGAILDRACASGEGRSDPRS